jgi:hypothetical protein
MWRWGLTGDSGPESAHSFRGDAARYRYCGETDKKESKDLLTTFLATSKIALEFTHITKMLPPYEYKHYYDQLCEECEDEMVSQDEVTEEGGQCGECQKVMCEDCREGRECDICSEKLENGDDETSAAVCKKCTVKCKSCPDLLFHRSCLRGTPEVL